jgi:hypothetical protein
MIWYKFWHTYKGGREEIDYFYTDEKLSDENLKNEVEQWMGSYFHTAEHVRYGWEKIDRPPKDWLSGTITSLKTRRLEIDRKIENLEDFLKKNYSEEK